MLFNSTVFLLVFLPAVYVVFWQLRSKNARYIWLAITGYIFYGYWNPAFCLLMLASTLVSYTAGLGFLRWGDNARARRILLIAPIVVDLSLLGFFKYGTFGLSTVNSLLEWSGRPTFSVPQILLPVGISFYTFHTITYIVDSYRGVIQPTRNPFEFACYVSLFSQLVAGPIVRFRELQQDLENIDSIDQKRYWERGWSFFTIGLIQKVLVADTIAAIINPAFRNVLSLSSLDAWLAVIGYTYQLYFDFAGYSNMAVGLGYLFGMHIPQNFNSPYKALNPSDFWNRWHISLSRCLRDYLYIPMGGNRQGEWKTSRNLLVTMLLGGLWHGASWTFVAWGGYHGALLMLYRRYARYWDVLPTVVQRAGMFLLVVFGWTLFRAESWSQASALFRAMLTPQAGPILVGAPLLLITVGIAAIIAHTGPNTWEMKHTWRPATAAGIAVLFIVCLVRIYGSQSSPFLYFQF